MLCLFLLGSRFSEQEQDLDLLACPSSNTNTHTHAVCVDVANDDGICVFAYDR